MQRSSGEYTWVHVVLQVRDSPDSTQQPVIVCTNQVLNDREASVMLANSWLYHYYTVQSKIQFGMPLDSGMRVPPGSTSSGYYSPHSTHSQQPQGGTTPGLSMTNAATGMASVFGSHHHPHHPHHTHHHHHHHHPAAAYHHHPHMGTYGGVYHAEAAIELKEDQPLFSFQEPVDYSQVNGGAGTGSGGNGVSPVTPNASTTSNPTSSGSQKSTQSATPPPPKKRARNKLEPLYLHAERSPAAAITPEPDCYALHTHPAAAYATSAVASSDASVIYATIVPTRPRLPNKSLPPDPADFIEQWNPSPPWSESAQKASLDSFGSNHELSPCITTTPPTPTSATPHQSGLGTQTIGPAFSFEWMSDPLVPLTYQQWPPTGDHHQQLSQHLAATQQQHQQQQQNQPHHHHPHQHQQHLLLQQQQQQSQQQQSQQSQHLTLHHVHVAGGTTTTTTTTATRAEHSIDGVAPVPSLAIPLPIPIPIPIAIPLTVTTGHADAGEPVEDRDPKN
ncbi:hybrid signal transduction histidine kinase B isoform X2 [Drosophila obscura]|nr:hybrid signal transduction histidine kinase B isoform X2 [Drosophila obscura]